MKAALFHEAGAPMTIETLAISKPGPHEVLVRVVASGLCHSDLHILDGSLPHPVPAIMGHEPAGIVEQVGPEVRGVKPGDHVVVCLTFNCGHCVQCYGGHSNRCTSQDLVRGADEPPRVHLGEQPVATFMNVGSFAEMILVHESGCVPISKDMPLDRACLIGCGVTTGLGAAMRTANIQPGQTVAVIGCGGVGLAAIQGAQIAGARRVIAIDRVASKLELAREFGATDTIDASQGDIVAQVIELTGGLGVDHALEAIGRKDTIEAAFAMLDRGGTATVVGVASPSIKIELSPISFMREKRIQGSLMGGVRVGIDIPNYVDLYLQGRLNLDRLISQRLTLEEVNKGFDDMRKGEVARSVILFDA